MVTHPARCRLNYPRRLRQVPRQQPAALYNRPGKRTMGEAFGPLPDRPLPKAQRP